MPEAVASLIRSGFEVWVEMGAGEGAYVQDSEYEKAGAKIMNDAGTLLGEAVRFLSIGVVGFSWFAFGEATSWGEEVEARQAVARVGSETLYAVDLELPKEVMEQKGAELQPDEFEAWLENFKRQMLQRKLWSLLREQFMAERGVNPPIEVEIESFVRFMEESEVDSRREFQERQSRLKAELDSPGVSEQRRAEIEEYLATLEELIRFDEEQEKRRAEPGYVEMEERSRRRVGEVTIKQWKFYKALYERYGGRVIFQQAGWEPLDALKAFVDGIKKGENFEILDPVYADVMEEYYREFEEYFHLGHAFMEKSDADFYFERPWWERTKAEMREHGLLEE